MASKLHVEIKKQVMKNTKELLQLAYEAGQSHAGKEQEIDKLLDEGTKQCPARPSFENWYNAVMLTQPVNLENLQSKGKTKEEVKEIFDNIVEHDYDGYTKESILKAIEYAQSHANKDSATPFQCCPICNGSGQTYEPLSTGSYTTCSTCNGAKIIPMHANKDGWVSVAERLPELHSLGMSEDVLTIAGTKMSVKSYDHELKRWNGSPHITVKAWMPLPPKPQI